MPRRKLNVDPLAPGLAAQLLRGENLPAGQYTLRARQAPTGNWELFVDGAATRSGLDRAELLRCAALLRAAYTVGWFR